MKNFKKIVSVCTLALVMLVSFNVNAQDLKENTIILKSISSLNNFKEQYPKEYNLLNTEYIQNDEGIIESSNELKGLNYFTIPTMIDNNVVGRLLYYNGETQYIDFSNYKNEVIIHIITKDKIKSSVTIPMVYNSKNDVYEISGYQNRGWLCGVGCTLATMAIIASDGPAPLMDIIAVAYYAVCMADCRK